MVSHQTFVESRPVNRSVIVVPRDRLDQARVVGFAARVTPTRQSVLAQPTIIDARRRQPEHPHEGEHRPENHKVERDTTKEKKQL